MDIERTPVKAAGVCHTLGRTDVLVPHRAAVAASALSCTVRGLPRQQACSAEASPGRWTQLFRKLTPAKHADKGGKKSFFRRRERRGTEDEPAPLTLPSPGGLFRTVASQVAAHTVRSHACSCVPDAPGLLHPFRAP